MNQAEHLHELQSINSFAGRIRYADQNFSKISQGSSRSVYDIGNNRVVKLARNKMGISQNTTEGDSYLANMFNILSPSISTDGNGLYVVAKKYNTAKSIQEVCKRIGVDKATLDKFVHQMNRNILHRNSRQSVDHVENEFIMEMAQICVDSDMLPGDWNRPSSYGIDPDTDRLILIDWGLSRDVYIEHYHSNKSNYGLSL